MSSRAWVLRPIVWFTAASMVTTIVHEFTHASVAYVLGVPSTLFSYFVDLDLAQPSATIPRRAVIGVSGPLICLALGVLAWLAFRRARHSAAALPLLYLTVFGIATFFGNLMSIAFVGDFSSVALMLHVPMGLRYLLTAIGALGVAAMHFWAGRELVRLVPASVDTIRAMLCIVALPALLGTVAIVLVNQPMAWTRASVRFVEAGFWLFAALGALAARRPSQNEADQLRVRWVDVAVLLFAVSIVRVMVPGIAFTP